MLDLLLPPWLRPLMPWAGGLAALLAILGAVWWIDRNAAQRTRAQIEAGNIRTENALRTDLRQTEARLAGSIMAITDRTSHQIAGIETLHRTVIQPTLIKELSRETRFADPAAGITDGVRAQINAAITAVTCAARPDGGIVCTLPDVEPAAQQ